MYYLFDYEYHQNFDTLFIKILVSWIFEYCIFFNENPVAQCFRQMIQVAKQGILFGLTSLLLGRKWSKYQFFC